MALQFSLRRLSIMTATVVLGCLVSLSLYIPCRAELSVTVSIAPQKNLVERIGGEHVNVDVLLPSDADPHTFEPKPSQLRKIAKTDLYIAIGLPFEDAWLHRLTDASRGTNGKGVTVVEMHTKLLVPEHEGEHEEHEHEGHEHHAHESHQHGGPNDPHRWLSPMLMKFMGKDVCAALIKADPENAPAYRANYRKLAKELADLDAKLANLLGSIPAEKRRFMVFHPAWHYFAQSYGLEEVAIEVDGREPTPQQLIKIIDMARTQNITTIFIQPQFSKRAAETIAQEIGNGVTLIEADPMVEDWELGITRLAEQIAK